jgi:2-polyprenyl-3-methyl-5-hydroxy-6-metoxy-1,4-benzoquinol methylase
MADRVLSHAEKVRQLFDAKAATWSEKYAPEGRLAGRVTQLACAVGHHASSGERVLDLGCGTGELARYMAFMGLRVTGCDISPEMLVRAATADKLDAVDWVQLDPNWQTLPFEAGTFDVVVAASVLEYVNFPDDFLRECARLLRPSGNLLCTVPDPTHPIRWLEWLAAKILSIAPLRATGENWPRLDRYRAYLQTSRQRRSAGWWRTTASYAGLSVVPTTSHAARRSPLRILTLSA